MGDPDMKQRFRVGGMSCAACSAHVEKSVSAVPGVSEVQVNLLAGSMAVQYDETVSKRESPAAILRRRTTGSSRPRPRRTRKRTTSSGK